VDDRLHAQRDIQPGMIAPEFARGEWLNNNGFPLLLESLRGQAVLIDMWDYTCVNCLRTLPYVQEMHRRYAEKGLVVIGVHTPRFAFGRERAQVERAVEELNIAYPVLLDNDLRTWQAYGSRDWPSRYLVDQHGFLRASEPEWGDGGSEFEQAIQSILREINSDVELPPVYEEAPPAPPRHRPTPELRGGLAGGLGNPEGYAGGVPMVYRLPQRRAAGAFYVAGAWQADNQFLAYQGQTEGIITLPYEAVEVNAVLSPHYETVERMLHPEIVGVEIWQDDRPLSAERRGADITEDGRVLVDRPRVYNLIRNPGFEQHELTLRVRSRGFAVYEFTFMAR
jgi:thiol-disulfide isomerase/thioredoxin